MRTLQFIAVLLLVSAIAERVEGQEALPGAPPPRPLELIDPNCAAPTPPAPGPYVPPTSSQYAPAEGIQAAPADNRFAPAPAQPTLSYGGQASAATMDPGRQPPDISPNNPEKWRYMYRNGAWWYYTPTKQWMYWSDGRCVQYARPAVSNTSVYVQPPVISRPRFNIGVRSGPGYYPYGPYGYGGVGVGMY